MISGTPGFLTATTIALRVPRTPAATKSAIESWGSLLQSWGVSGDRYGIGSRRLRGHPSGEAQRHHDHRPGGVADGARLPPQGRRADGDADRSPGAQHRGPARTVRAKGASLKATEQPIDTSTAAGKCRHAGRVKGRPASIDAAQVRGMKAQGVGATTSPRRWVLAVRASTGRCNRKRHTGTRLDGFDQELSLSIRDAALHART
jgi:hypothetical protein